MSDDDQSGDDLARRKAQEPKRLPVAYSEPGGQGFTGSAPVIAATEQEIRRFSSGGNICGECRFFEPGHAASEIVRTKWMQQLVSDYGWKIEHAFPGITRERTQEIGLCAAAGDTGTTAFTASCDQFRPARGRLKKEADVEERGYLVADMRKAKITQEERIARWKREMGIDGPGSDPNG